MLPVCPCVRVVLQSPRARHARLVADKSLASSYSILVRHVRHARFPRNMLATSSRGCHQDATRKLLPWNFSLTEYAETDHGGETVTGEVCISGSLPVWPFLYCTLSTCKSNTERPQRAADVNRYNIYHAELQMLYIGPTVFVHLRHTECVCVVYLWAIRPSSV